MDPKIYHDLDNFVRLHSHKLPLERSDEKIAHLVKWSNVGIPLAVPLKAYSLDDIMQEFNTESTTVRWLLNQLSTYDAYNSHIIGFIINRENILAHVVQRGGVRTESYEDD